MFSNLDQTSDHLNANVLCHPGDADTTSPKIRTCPTPLLGRYVTIQKLEKDPQGSYTIAFPEVYLYEIKSTS